MPEILETVERRMKIRTETQTLTGEAAPDPIALIQALAPDDEAVLFESPAGEGRRAERSFLFPRNALRIEGREDEVRVEALTDAGVDALGIVAPALERIASVERDSRGVVANFADRPRSGDDIARIKAVNTTGALRAVMEACSEASGGASPITLPGAFSYDLMERFEELPEARSDGPGFPDFVFYLPEAEVVITNADRRCQLIQRSFSGKAPEAIDIDLVAEALSSCAEPDPALEVAGEMPRCDVDIGDGEFAALVSKLKDHVRCGDVFQIVPSRSFRTPCEDPLLAYRMLRAQNPSPYMFFMRGPGFALFGASPEVCVKVAGRPRRVEIHPIAGTKPRGRLPGGEIDRDLDDRLEAELRLNEKELAEHMMLVDMARNDVARISRTGTRRVRSLCALEKYSRVMHLVSMVEGELRDDLDALHAYVASMNMGTVVGAPKIEAARLLRLHERDRRGPYAGAVGYLTSEGEMDTAIVIRSALVRDGVATVRAGAGVVYDSDPHAEANETRHKAGAVLRAIGASMRREGI